VPLFWGTFLLKSEKMARTQLNNTQILEGSLTGADLTKKIGIYDESSDYTINDYVLWLTTKYKCTSDVLGGEGGDLSNSPDINTGSWVSTSLDGGYF